MALIDWIDAVAKRWGTIEDGRGGMVRSYRIFERAEMPESISQYPCVISYVTRQSVAEYSAGGPNVMVYQGQSEFHLAANLSKGNYPYMMMFYDRIIIAAAGSITLGGLVSHFLLARTDPIRPAALQYGDEAPHLGLVVSWEVKENIVLSVSA